MSKTSNRNASGAYDPTAKTAIDNVIATEKDFYIAFSLNYKITGIDSINAIYSGGHWTKRSDYQKKIKMIVKSRLHESGYKKNLAKVPVNITFTFPKDRLDIDNHSYFSKCVIDALKEWFIVDDTGKYVRGVSQMFDESRGDILIEIESAK